MPSNEHTWRQQNSNFGNIYRVVSLEQTQPDTSSTQDSTLQRDICLTRTTVCLGKHISIMWQSHAGVLQQIDLHILVLLEDVHSLACLHQILRELLPAVQGGSSKAYVGSNHSRTRTRHHKGHPRPLPGYVTYQYTCHKHTSNQAHLVSKQACRDRRATAIISSAGAQARFQWSAFQQIGNTQKS